MPHRRRQVPGVGVDGAVVHQLEREGGGGLVQDQPDIAVALAGLLELGGPDQLVKRPCRRSVDGPLGGDADELVEEAALGADRIALRPGAIPDGSEAEAGVASAGVGGHDLHRLPGVRILHPHQPPLRAGGIVDLPVEREQAAIMRRLELAGQQVPDAVRVVLVDRDETNVAGRGQPLRREPPRRLGQGLEHGAQSLRHRHRRGARAEEDEGDAVLGLSPRRRDGELEEAGEQSGADLPGGQAGNVAEADDDAEPVGTAQRRDHRRRADAARIEAERVALLQRPAEREIKLRLGPGDRIAEEVADDHGRADEGEIAVGDGERLSILRGARHRR